MATGTVYSSWSNSAVPAGGTAARKIRSYYTWTSTEYADKVTIAVKCYIQMNGGSATFNCTEKLAATGYDTTSYSKGFEYQGDTVINVVNKTFTYSKTTAAQTKTISFSLINTGKFSGTYTASKSFTIPALAKYTVTFDANEGSGSVPNSINPYYGVSTSVPTTTLTRTGYTFIGWNSKADGTGTAYTAGNSAKFYGDATLYAQWKSTYVAPTLSGLIAYRVASGASGKTPPSTLSGTKGYCELIITGGTGIKSKSVNVYFGSNSYTVSMASSDTAYYGYSSNVLSGSDEYDVVVTVTIIGDDGITRTISLSTYISKEEYIMDISANGRCVAFGTAASDDIGPEDNKRYMFDGDLEIMGKMLLDYCHPVGEIFLTVDETFNPETEWGGTWEQLTADAYFKIVTENAGTLAGTSSSHKIPLTSIPSHRHSMGALWSAGSGGSDARYMTSSNRTTMTRYTTYEGGGNAYYPYYYGVIAWRRTA